MIVFDSKDRGWVSESGIALIAPGFAESGSVDPVHPPSSSATMKSTGREPAVVRKTVSRARVSAVEYRCANTKMFWAVGSAASTVTAYS